VSSSRALIGRNALKLIMQRLCKSCATPRPIEHFGKNRRFPDGLQRRCVFCCRASSRRYRAAGTAQSRDRRAPRRLRPSGEAKEIAAVHREARRLTRETGIAHAVDHIVPLVSPLVQSLDGPNVPNFVGPVFPIVCGMHVLANLRALTAHDNVQKGNRYWPDMPDHPVLLAALAAAKARAATVRPILAHSGRSTPASKQTVTTAVKKHAQLVALFRSGKASQQEVQLSAAALRALRG
jgi:hypothetical protein